MNDIVIFSRTLQEHLVHLRFIFELFFSLHISLSLKKVFLEYSSVILLEQRVNDLDLVTAAEKLKAITKLWFSATLDKLNTYLELIEWLRDYV